MRITGFQRGKYLLAPFLVALGLSAQAQVDITQPGDPVFASSVNSPGSEGVANAIDNTQAKYLNFDGSTGNGLKPTGFAVSPAVGATRVTGMRIQAANDAPERDPRVVTLEGSNDDTITSYAGGNWEVITTITDTVGYAARFERKTFTFTNFEAYKHYRWTVVSTATDNGCCMQVSEVELLGTALPTDVTQPGDPVVASSVNSPGSEGVANAIDNTQAKYLNFDASTGNGLKPTGFIVSPAVGKTLVSGMTIQAANDAPERDPRVVTLEGSNDATVGAFGTGNWETIVTLSAIPTFAARFEKQTFLFDNFKPYTHYRWTVVSTATDNGCCMQVAEVELLGTGAPKDITQPGDALVASSVNSPGSEGVANAIDNTQAKYLNFDASTGNGLKPTGFIVTPGIGASTVIGMTIQAANDAPERDPKNVRLEGSNDDTVTTFAAGNWELVTLINDIPAFASRFETKEFYFANNKSFKHYRWTVLATATENGCCMQVSEVELLAATQSNPCDQTEFIEAPVDTGAILGTPATFLSKVNGPWTVQWLKNGVPIPGATKTSYTTQPVTVANSTNVYALEIVGCQVSQGVRATVFTPSVTKSIAISFVGGGANGAPTSMEPLDIAGVHPQAYWNNATNDTGATGDGTAFGDPFTDSDNNASTITVDYATSGQWGAGTAVDSANDKMFNGLVGSGGVNIDNPGTLNFNNVPDGNHSVLIYVLSPPLQFQKVSYTIGAQTYVIRAMNSDEYKPAPGFYRGTTTSAANAAVANFVRFDNVRAVGGIITLTVATVEGSGQATGLNGIQMLLNAPNPGLPPVVTVDPLPTVVITNGTATLTVTATGENLTYQWRKNGRNLSNSENVTGAKTATLEISSFSGDNEGIYSVAVFNPAGSVVSKNAYVSISKYNISDRLVGHWKFDETSGLVAANSAAGGSAGRVEGTPVWGAGQIANALTLDGASYVFVPNYTKAKKQISASAWVNVAAGTGTEVAVIRNANGGMSVASGFVGQFELGLVPDAEGLLRASAAIGIGPNIARVTAPAAFPLGSYHHLAFSADGAQFRLYVDGQQVAAVDYLADINTPDIAWLSIGARLVNDTSVDPAVIGPDPAASNYLPGSVDDIGLWTRALTAEEVGKINAAGQAKKSLSTVVIEPPVPTVRPTLTVTRTGGNVVISWPASAGYVLESTDTLPGPADWDHVAGVVNNSFTVAPGAAAKYYRLHKH